MSSPTALKNVETAIVCAAATILQQKYYNYYYYLQQRFYYTSYYIHSCVFLQNSSYTRKWPSLFAHFKRVHTQVVLDVRISTVLKENLHNLDVASHDSRIQCCCSWLIKYASISPVFDTRVRYNAFATK